MGARILTSRTCWVVAWVLAFAAGVLYALWPGDLTWWVTPFLALPLVLMVMWRKDGLTGDDDVSPMPGDETPWAPPVDHGGGWHF